MRKTVFTIFCLFSSNLFAQTPFSIPALPYLTIAPDARHVGMGSAGVATSADASSMYFNPAKLALSDRKFGVHASTVAWLRNLTADMRFSNLGFYIKDKEGSKNTFGFSSMVFNSGTIEFRTATGQSSGDFPSKDMVLGLHYSRIMGKNLSFGANLKYARSNVNGNIVVNNQVFKSANTVLLDLGVFKMLNIRDNIDLGLGLSMVNLGGKISYGRETYNPPTSLRVGVSPSFVSGKNRVNFALDVLKNFNNSLSKKAGVLIGGEYWYNNWVAGRAGYTMNTTTDYFSLGLGVRFMKQFGLDFAYIKPENGGVLGNNKRISLVMDFKSFDSKVRAEM